MTDSSTSVGGPKPMIIEGPTSRTQVALLWTFIIGPTLLALASVFVMWGWGVSWRDLVLATVLGFFSLLGVTTGYHRYLTHGSFKAKRPLRVVLAVWPQFGFQGPPITWVADHRRHHAFSDREGDPHSPWLYGTGVRALIKGFWHAHMGWLLFKTGQKTNAERFAPDLLADRDIRRVNGWFGWITVINLALPALIGGLWSWSLWGAVTAFFWAGLVRVAVVHHITWCTNSVGHMAGERPYKSRDKATNFWLLAIPSMGESWHNTHHADPTCARHGVDPGQVDITARTIWIFEKLGWASDVRWPSRQRFNRLRTTQR